jgi:hypothetical protein
MFNSGLTEESIQCSVWKNVTKQQIPFEELILYLDKSHHDDNKKHNSCTLGELFTSYFTTNDDNLERECHTCNERRRSTVQNCICCYPEVLCTVLCRNIFKDNTSSRILSSVDFPVENFKPNEHFGIHEGTDDTTYYLIALVNHHPRPNNRGHYTAICWQHESGTWYEYDDDQENIANFSKMCHGICTLKSAKSCNNLILFK